MNLGTKFHVWKSRPVHLQLHKLIGKNIYIILMVDNTHQICTYLLERSVSFYFCLLYQHSAYLKRLVGHYHFDTAAMIVVVSEI